MLTRLPLQPRGIGTSPVWPRSVAIAGTPEVATIQEDDASRSFTYQSPSYEFTADVRVGADAMREFARVFEAALELNKQLPLALRPAPESGRSRFRALLFGSQEAYQAAGGMTGSGGMYDRRRESLLVPISSLGAKLVGGRIQIDRGGRANSALIHEITHQAMSVWLPRLPQWFAEGSAEYAAMLDYLHGRFTLTEPEQQFARHLRLRGAPGANVTLLRPSNLMSVSAEAWHHALASSASTASANYLSALALVFYFYHLDGAGDAAHVVAWLKDIEEGMPESEATKKHLLRERSPAGLDRDVAGSFALKTLPAQFGR